MVEITGEGQGAAQDAKDVDALLAEYTQLVARLGKVVMDLAAEGVWADPLEGWLSWADFAGRAGLRYTTVRKYEVEGRLPLADAHVAGLPLWRVETVDRWLAEREARRAGNAGEDAETRAEWAGGRVRITVAAGVAVVRTPRKGLTVADGQWARLAEELGGVCVGEAEAWVFPQRELERVRDRVGWVYGGSGDALGGEAGQAGAAAGGTGVRITVADGVVVARTPSVGLTTADEAWAGAAAALGGVYLDRAGTWVYPGDVVKEVRESARGLYPDADDVEGPSE